MHWRNIYGSLIRAKVSEELAGRFRGRKGGTTQNILASITFDLRFTYVLAGWEGSAHDSRIIENALERPGGLVIPEGTMMNSPYSLSHWF